MNLKSLYMHFWSTKMNNEQWIKVRATEIALTGASDFAKDLDGGSFRAKCKKRIAHKVTPRGYTKQTPIGRPMPSKVHDWSKVVGRLTYPQSNVTSHANSRGSNCHPSPDLASGVALARVYQYIEPIVQKSNRTRRELFSLVYLIAKGLIAVCSKGIQHSTISAIM